MRFMYFVHLEKGINLRKVQKYAHPPTEYSIKSMKKDRKKKKIEQLYKTVSQSIQPN